MKRIITPIIQYIINKAKKSRFVQTLFEAPFNLEKFEKFGVFTDSFGNNFQLLKGLRSKIKPGWENMLSSSRKAITYDYLKKQKLYGEVSVNKIFSLLKVFGKEIKGSSILEFGCHSGACSFTMAEMGAKKVIGSEFSGYKIKSIDQNNNSINQLEEVNLGLKELRIKLGCYYKNKNLVEFVDDDICHSNLDKESFDIIYSMDVLEHLHNTKNAFKNIAALLKNDGITIHEYNPFFCLNGGHSLCTLDFLWGHARLNETDFINYIEQIRPVEKQRAISFYKEGLNRMTLADLKTQMYDAGLEILSVLPYIKEQHVRMITKETLMQTKNIYPNLSLIDLVAPVIIVVAKKVCK